MLFNRRFLPLLLALVAAGAAWPIQAAEPRLDTTKSTMAIRLSFGHLADAAAKSTVRILVNDGDKVTDKAVPTAYGTVMTADGFILTKASEIINHKKIFVKLNGQELAAKITGVRESYDLAMLKIDAKDLVPVVLADTSPPPRPAPATQATVRRRPGRTFNPNDYPDGPIPAVTTPPAPSSGTVAVTVGQFVVTPEAAASEPPAAAGLELAPKSYGVISADRRRIPLSSGVLGVSLAEAPVGGALVTRVYMQSGASRAGVQSNDVITAIDGTAVRTVSALQNLIRKHYPTDTVTLTITRGTQTLTLHVQLGDTILATREDVEMAVLSGNVSARASDFQAVFQHDTLLAPSDMGGPLVDLDGHVIGINIARAGRTETYAIPADLLTERWLNSMKDGTFIPKPRPTP